MRREGLFTIGIVALLSIAMLISLVQPTQAFISWTDDDEVFEKWGPKTDQLDYVIYDNLDSLYSALETGDVDVINWEVDKVHVNKWLGGDWPTKIKLTPYKGLGFRAFDINHYRTVPTYPLWTSPTYYLEFRQALAHCVNKTWIVSELLGGLAGLMPGPVMDWLTDWYNPDIPTYDYDPAVANQILDAGGWVQGSTDNPYYDPSIPWSVPKLRTYKTGHEKAGEDLDPLIFYTRSDDPPRRDAGAEFARVMRLIGIPIDLRPQTSAVCYEWVMRRCDFHFYTAGWSVGRFPTFLYGIYQGPQFYFYQPGCEPEPGNISSYFDLYGSNNPSLDPPYLPSAGPNYIRFCNYTFDLAAETFRLAKTLDEAKDACKLAQVIFQDAVATIPLWYVKGFGAYRVWSSRAPNGWAGGVNGAGAGANNIFTLINLYPKPGPEPIPTPTRVKWGGARPPEMINPIYSSWVWDWDVIDNAMGYLLAVDPISLADIPPARLGGTGWIAYDWEQTTWVDPADGQTKSKVRYYLRNDLVFHDGTPFTADDLVWAIEYGKKMVAWWYDSVKDFLSWYPVDPYTVDILMAVESYWSVYWIGGVPLLPKHIWTKVADPKAFMPDPTLTGLGYWDFIQWDATNKIATFNRNPYYFLNKPAQAFVGTPHIVYGPPWGKDFDFTVAVENLLADAPEEREFTCSGWVHIRKEGQGVNETIAYETITNIDPATIIRLGPYNTGPLYKDQAIIVTYEFTITVTNPEHTEIVTGTYVHKTWSTYREDLNLDMFVDGLDISPAARAFGSRPGHPRWNSRCDLNNDFFVDGLDISRIARNFGKSSPSPP